MKKVSLTIDDVDIKEESDMTVLEAASKNGIYIPHLCHHPDLSPSGVCRLCMVEITGRGLSASCMTPIEEGMKVSTATPDVMDLRRNVLELLLSNHSDECLGDDTHTECRLKDIAVRIGVDMRSPKRFRSMKPNHPVDDSNPFFSFDPNKCVLCGICVRTCDEIQGVSALDFTFRGFETKVSTFGNAPLAGSRCESCGECVVRCPTGALGKHGIKPTREVDSICPYCGVGCGIHLGIKDGAVVSVRGDARNPVNRGRLCVKGRFGSGFINHRERLTTPLIKKDGNFMKATWDEAFDLVAERFSSCKGSKFALIASAKCTNEENYIFQKFARVVMGTNNVDHCARLCHSPTVAGLLRSLGSGAMTNPIADIRGAACIFALGTNTTETHPVIGLEIKQAVRNGAKLIVINPKNTDLERYAEVYIRPRPGTDVALLMGIAKVIIDEGLHDQSFIERRCEDYDAFLSSIKDFDMRSMVEITGVPLSQVLEAARIYAALKPSSILYAMGATQHTHGTDNVLALSNLVLLTGNVGKPSSGINPLRGQNNVQGACDMGCLPNLFPGYQTDKTMFESAWECRLSGVPGLALTEMFDASKIRTMYLIGENPVLSDPDSGHVRAALEGLDFLVVQDIFLTETAQFADVVLPASSFAEKDGTFTNTERRVQRIKRAVEPVGLSLPDWEITCSLARKMGGHGFDFKRPSDIMQEVAGVVPVYRGVSYERLDRGGIQWPCPHHLHPGTAVLHKDRFDTPTGKGRFVSLGYRPPEELPDASYPFILTTCRSLYHYHTGTMTRRVDGLNLLSSQELAELNPRDAEALGLEDGDMARVSSRRGAVDARIKITNRTQRGVVSMTFHFHECPTNELTSAALDPNAGIPEAKVCAVKVEPVKQIAQN